MAATNVFQATLALLRKNPEYADLLAVVVEFEKEHEGEEYFKTLGWEWRELRIEPSKLKKLFLLGILNQPHRSRSHKGYLLADREDVTRALLFTQDEQTEIVAEEQPFAVPKDLFDDVVGYDGVKTLFRRGLASRVHFLMVGPPASAKSLFLLCLERLHGTKYVIGSRTTKAGLSDYLTTYKPNVLLVDEFDKMKAEDMAVLLSLCESGRVPVTLYGKTTDVTLDTVVFACANTIKRIPKEVLSRFEKLTFRTYSRKMFVEVTTNVLARRGVDNNSAVYIAKQVWDVLESKDPREAIRVAKLAKTKAEVNNVIRILQQHQ